MPCIQRGSQRLCLLGRWGTLLSPSWQCTCPSMCPTSTWQHPAAGPPWSTTRRWSSPSSTTQCSGGQVCPVGCTVADPRSSRSSKWWLWTAAGFLSCCEKCTELGLLSSSTASVCWSWKADSREPRAEGDRWPQVLDTPSWLRNVCVPVQHEHVQLLLVKNSVVHLVLRRKMIFELCTETGNNARSTRLDSNVRWPT